MADDLITIPIAEAGPESLCIRALRPDGEFTRCTTECGDIVVPRVPAIYLRSGDEIRVSSLNSPVDEYLAVQNSVRRKARRLYFVRIGCVTQPKTDRRGDYFVRAEVPESAFGIRALQLTNAAVRDYFYVFARTPSGPSGPTLYEILRTTPTAKPADLRLAYRVRRIEIESLDPGSGELQRVERAFNLLAHPDLRSCYDALLRDAAAPALFPYGGFGQCVISGDLADDGKTFFAHRLLSYRPDQRPRHFRAPLRRIDHLNGYAYYRDSRRRVEVRMDPTLLAVSWDPTWNQWRHLVGSKIGISGVFVQSGKYRRNGEQWHLVRWETALPSRLSVTVPSDAEQAVTAARRAYRRFGVYQDSIERIKVRLAQEPLNQAELGLLCRKMGIPNDFDMAQFCWKPDYDPYFYQQLKKRCQDVYYFRNEFLFQLPNAIVAEVPQLGHATYVFARPGDVHQFVCRYAITCRDDIRKNRGNVAGELGFIGRVMHGANLRTWLRELRARVGEPVDYSLAIT